MKWYVYQVEIDDHTVNIYGMYDDEHGAKSHVMDIMNAYIDDIESEFSWKVESDMKNNRMKLFRGANIDDEHHSLLRYVGWVSH